MRLKTKKEITQKIILQLKMDKKLIKLTRQDLHNIVRESVSRVLKEDYDANYYELIKREMHNLYDLEVRMPEYLRPQIHSMAAELEGILYDIRTKGSIASI